MKFTLNKKENYTHVLVDTEKVYHSDSVKLRKLFTDLHNSGVQTILLTLSKVKFLDSKCLFSILTGSKVFKKKHFFITDDIQPQVRGLFEMNSIQEKLNLIPVDDAKKYFEMEDVV